MPSNHVVVLSSESYGDLLIQVQKWYENEGKYIKVQDSHYLSDRFSKRVYHVLIYRFED